MEIAAITHTLDGGLSALRVAFADGTRAEIFEPKLTLLRQHIVVLLGDGWETATSADAIDGDTAEIVPIPGGLRSPVLAYLAGEMVHDRLPLGTIPVPDEDTLDPFFADEI